MRFHVFLTVLQGSAAVIFFTLKILLFPNYHLVKLNIYFATILI